MSFHQHAVAAAYAAGAHRQMRSCPFAVAAWTTCLVGLCGLPIIHVCCCCFTQLRGLDSTNVPIAQSVIMTALWAVFADLLFLRVHVCVNYHGSALGFWEGVHGRAKLLLCAIHMVACPAASAACTCCRWQNCGVDTSPCACCCDIVGCWSTLCMQGGRALSTGSCSVD
jgi:hypothetical protein